LGLQIETSSVPQHRRNQEKFGVFSYEQKDKKLEAAILEYHREDYEVYLKGLAHFKINMMQFQTRLHLHFIVDRSSRRPGRREILTKGLHKGRWRSKNCRHILLRRRMAG